MIRLTEEQVLRLHDRMAEATGGDAGIRDHALLESALASPFATFGGEDLYPTMIEKAARLGYALISNHAFTDGNKRIGMYVMLVFCEVNGISLRLTDGDVYRMGMGVADGTISYEALLAFLRARV